MPFALAASFVTAAPVSCNQLRSIVLITLHFVALAPAHVHSVWVMILPALNAHNHKLHSLPSQSSLHSITLHYALFHSAGRSTPAAIVVLACAVVRAAGCHVFCISTCWLTRDQLLSTTNRTKAKNHASPCSVHPLPQS